MVDLDFPYTLGPICRFSVAMRFDSKCFCSNQLFLVAVADDRAFPETLEHPSSKTCSSLECL